MKGWLLPGTFNKALVGKFSICLIIVLEHSESQLEGDQLLYQYPGLPKNYCFISVAVSKKARVSILILSNMPLLLLTTEVLAPILSG